MKGQFTLEDFLIQIREMRKLGPIQDQGDQDEVPVGETSRCHLSGWWRRVARGL